ncbi:hypothetical protein GUITHDRAFT_106416 [Guillardia theta CCMP2712]|uniref:Uncharacterized protein n=1 Tax=Guillardia theta (strain CCMP2712) TaxID=905079 RepID=L1JHT7_GUITC|nr:hypothetical protein GUITHDRAFT_106416 [Guillardia theta CCMP2712]EKX47867.1 hypothetical protein GUITHDRAFT_106416 [Guillardia theta CCMP2712]|eukprot:XP_005834847.1 hypothetical protein GUITHDRAFT_106416 [Guillardia theta CCMP2712]
MRTAFFVLCLCLLLAHVEASMPPSCKPVNARNDNADLNTFSTIAKEMGLPLGLSSSSAEEQENDDDEPSEQLLLWNASTAGKIYDIELALRRSASLEKFNKDGITSLHMAIKEHRLGAAALLVAKGCDVNASHDLPSTLLLLDLGALPNHADDKGILPLHEAVMNGNKGVLSCLLNAGSDPFAVTFERISVMDMVNKHIENARKREEFVELISFYQSRSKRPERRKEEEDYGKTISLNNVLEAVEDLKKHGNNIGDKEVDMLVAKITGASKQREEELSEIRDQFPPPLREERAVLQQGGADRGDLSQLDSAELKAAMEEDRRFANQHQSFFQEFKAAREVKHLDPARSPDKIVEMFPVKPVEAHEGLSMDEFFDGEMQPVAEEAASFQRTVKEWDDNMQNISQYIRKNFGVDLEGAIKDKEDNSINPALGFYEEDGKWFGWDRQGKAEAEKGAEPGKGGQQLWDEDEDEDEDEKEDEDAARKKAEDEEEEEDNRWQVDEWEQAAKNLWKE